MKREHYPVVTVALATLLTALPLLLLSWSLYGRSSDADIAVEASRDAELISTVIDSPTTPMAGTAAIPNGIITSEFRDPPETAAPDPVIEKSTVAARRNPDEFPERMPGVDVAIPSVSNLNRDVPNPPDAMGSDVSGVSLAPVPVPASLPQAAPVVSDTGIMELPPLPVAGANYYEATGHLALRTQPQIRDSLAERDEPPAHTTEPKAVSEATEASPENSRKSNHRRSKNAQKKAGGSVVDESSSDPALRDDVPRSVSSNSVTDEAIIEDVVVQTPVESALVGRVENVVAMTRAKGWPIALIRSDLPDDVWWVQQVVGIQGNSFAARVNFGNENSLSGSAFSMVIVFLDSPDEVRRFRIAKQFKDIPKGVRRSREFHYIRN